MKFFLSSKAISDEQGNAFMKLVGKTKPEEIKIALIENAADVYEETNKGWMYENRRNIQAHKFQVDLVDLEDYRHDHKGLLERLNVADAIWLGGGNTYYLRWILKTTGADSIITKLVQKGTVYGGGSAGAIIAGPTIDHFQTAEDPSKAPELILDGLGLIDVVVLPHWGNEKYGKLMEGIKSKLHDAKSETVEIRDTEAVIFENGQQTIIGI